MDRIAKCRLIGAVALALFFLPIVAWAAVPQRPVIGPRPVVKRHYRAKLSNPGYNQVSSHEYQAVREMGTKLLRKYSPKHHYFIGLGHSPSKLIAFMQALSPEMGRTFPASGLSSFDHTDSISSNFGAYRKHMDALLPESVVKGTRDIVLLDYSSGPSLRNFRYALRRYLKEKKSKAKVINSSFYSGARAGQGGVDYVVSGQDNTVYDGGAEIAEFRYGSHSIGSNSLQSLRPDSRWAQRVTNYTEHMKTDKILDSFVANALKVLLKPLSAAELGAGPDAKTSETSTRTRRTKTRAATAKRANKPTTDGAATVPISAQAAKGLLEVQDRHGKTSSVLSLAERQQLVDALSPLAQAYAPKAYHFVGVGRTSTPFVSGLEAMKKGLATYLPIDGVSKSLTTKGTIRAEYRQAYFDLFDKLLPANVKSGRKSVVLMKKSNSGRTLRAVYRLLQEYLDDKSMAKGSGAWSGRIEMVGFGDQPGSSKALSKHIDIAKAPQLEALLDGAHKAIAPYEYHQVGRTKKLRPRSEHARYQKRLEQLLGSNAFVKPLRKALGIR